MRKYLLFLIVLFFFSSGIVFANPSDDNKKEIRARIAEIEEAVNTSETEKIKDALSPNAPEILKKEIQKNIEGKHIAFQQNIESINEISQGKIRVEGTFLAEGGQWNIPGFSDYFVFEKRGKKWYLLESDFAQKLDSKIALKMAFGNIAHFLPALLLIFFCAFLFWIFMIVDILKRPIKNKTIWLLIIIVFNFSGALTYFLTVRRKHKKDNMVGVH